MENPFWRAPRIHGELFKLGFEAAHSSVAKYMEGDVDRQARDGKHFCAIRRRTSLPWTCLLSRFDECLDHVVVFGERYLHQVLQSYESL